MTVEARQCYHSAINRKLSTQDPILEGEPPKKTVQPQYYMALVLAD